jgi:hypothetical protein
MSYIIIASDGEYSVDRDTYNAICNNELGLEQLKLLAEVSDEIIKL